MIKCATIFTQEIDETDLALNDLKQQLDEKLELLTHTVGIVLCDVEFLESDVLKELSSFLKFEIAGITTSSQSACKEIGDLMLSLFVITSDDVEFRVGVTECLMENIYDKTLSAYQVASVGMKGEPDLALIFTPIIKHLAGDEYVATWSLMLPRTPVFGGVTTDNTIKWEESETIYNGKHYKTALPFILCYGPINPRFMIISFPEEKALPYSGVITKSKGSFVYEINNMNIYDYFDSIGLFLENLLFVSFLIHQKNDEVFDNTPVVRGHAFFTEEKVAIFHGAINEGSTFTILRSDTADLVSSIKNKVVELNTLKNVNGVIFFSCIARQMMAMNQSSWLEMNTVKNTINHDIPYMFGYTTGEIAPTTKRDDIPVNRFHNYSIVMLII